jgi:hypothetical protein
MITGILAVEAVIIVGAMLFVGKPAPVSGEVAIDPAQADQDKIVELLVLDDKLPNNRSGLSYVYDTEIWIQVRQRNEMRVKEELERFRNEIKAELVAVWRSAEPRHFQEPMMENLTRKAQTLFDRRFGEDSETGEPVVEKTVIVSGTGFRVDG